MKLLAEIMLSKPKNLMKFENVLTPVPNDLALHSRKNLSRSSQTGWVLFPALPFSGYKTIDTLFNALLSRFPDLIVIMPSSGGYEDL